MGGTAGMVRRIIYGWNRPFTINQIKVAFHRRHPGLIPGDFQIEDIIVLMVERGMLVRIGDGYYQRHQNLRKAA